MDGTHLVKIYDTKFKFLCGAFSLYIVAHSRIWVKVTISVKAAVTKINVQSQILGHQISLLGDLWVRRGISLMLWKIFLSDGQKNCGTCISQLNLKTLNFLQPYFIWCYCRVCNLLLKVNCIFLRII